MVDDSSADEARALWQGQPATKLLTLPQVQRRGERMRRTLRVTAVLMTVMCIGLTVPFAFILADTHTFVERLGALLMFVGIGYLLSQLHRPWIEMRTPSATPAKPNSTSIEYYKSELERLRDFSTGRVFWSRYAMLFPGYLIYFVGRTVANPKDTEMKFVLIAALIISIAAIPLNLYGARGAQKKVDEVNRLLQENT